MVTDYNLSMEFCKSLTDAGRYEELFRFVNNLPDEIRSHGRIKIIAAQTALKKGDLNMAEKILKRQPSVPDVREGEITLSRLWFELHEKRISKAENIPVDENLRARVRKEFPPPIWLDFRQST